MEPVCEYPRDIVPINETRNCDKCGGFTWWATPRQKKNGRCITCAARVYFTATSRDHFTAVILDILDAFPGSSVYDHWQPERYPPNVYRGDGVGPCVDCRGRIRRYGAMGYPLCADCHNRRVELRVQAADQAQSTV